MTSPPAEPIRVLIADDELPARQRLLDLLHKDGQVGPILQAENGAAAVEMIRAQRPDILFLDVQMPELDGLGVIDAIGAKEMPGWRAVPGSFQNCSRICDG